MDSEPAEIFLIDIFFRDTVPDSIRLWPAASSNILDIPEIISEKPSYFSFRHVDQKHRYYRDLTDILGYWRGDTIDIHQKSPAHYGNFFDLEILPGGKVMVYSNIPDAPEFMSRRLYNGDLQFRFSDSSYQTVEFVDLGQNRARFSSSGEQAFAGSFSGIEAPNFQADPLSRFDDRSYIHLYIDGETDTLKFYLDQKISPGNNNIDMVEMSREENGSTLKIALTVKPGKGGQDINIFSASEPGFGTALELLTSSNETRLLYADTSAENFLPLRIKAWEEQDKPDIINGEILIGAMTDTTNSRQSMSGKFRYRRDLEARITSTFWDHVPVKQ